VAWDFLYTADAVALSDFSERTYIVTEGMAAREGINFSVPGLHGEVSYPFKMFEGANVVMGTFLRYTNPAGAITHADGAPGHIYENKAKMMEIFGKMTGLVTLQRTTPHQGANILEVELLGGVEAGDPMWNYLWVLRAPKPFWRATTTTTHASGTGSLARGGNAPVDDAIATFTGDGTVTVDSNGEKVGVAGSGGATVVVDCGKRTIKQGATNRDEWLVINSERWLPLDVTPVPITVVGTVSIAWFRKWH